MKLHADQIQSLNTITAYGPGFIEINRTQHRTHLIVAPEGPILPWSIQQFSALEEADFAPVVSMQPDVLILGTGTRQRFLPPKLGRYLITQRIGVEPMDTQAACRTYNILMAEGRKVVAALLLENA